MDVGMRVRCKRTGRSGRITALVDPPRNGRAYRIDWVGRRDFSLVTPDEIEPDPTPGPRVAVRKGQIDILPPFAD